MTGVRQNNYREIQFRQFLEKNRKTGARGGSENYGWFLRKLNLLFFLPWRYGKHFLYAVVDERGICGLFLFGFLFVMKDQDEGPRGLDENETIDLPFWG